MPATWAEVTAELKWGLLDRRLVEPSIEAGAYYMATLRKQWVSRDTTQEFAQASYNAGAGNIRRAWRRCEKPETWDGTVPCLSSVTGRHATETINYVSRIARWFKMMVLE